MEDDPKPQKTYKREVATAALVATFAIGFSGNTELAEILVWPVFMFAGAAFGLDAFAKQVQR